MAPSFSFGFSELMLANRLIEAGRTEPWTFEVVAAARDERRPFLIATGFEQVLDLLAGLALTEADLAPLRADSVRVEPPLDGPALARLAALRFRGDVFAVPEGTVVFPGEPLLRLRAAAPEAVVVGAAVVAMLRAQTAIASRAARMRLAAGGKPVWELGPSAITHEAALLASRAAFVGGVAATSHSLAAGAWGMPALAVVPLSQLSAMGESGRAFANCAVLLDGVGADQIEAAISGAPVKPRTLLVDVARMSDAPQRVSELRTSLDVQGWSEVGLVGTGELDEARLEELAPADVPLVGFAVGAAQFLADDPGAPVFVYELVESEVGGKRVALSRRDGGVGTRAVWRKRESGRFRADTVQPETKAPPSGSAPLLVPMMEKGKRLFRAPHPAGARALGEAQLSMFDPAVLRRADPQTYTVNCIVERPVPPPPPPKPAPAAKPAAPAPGRSNKYDQIDDSADFTFVSNVFESVASKFKPDADEPTEETADEMAEPVAEERDAVEPVEPEAPLASADASSASLDEEAPDFEEVVDPLPPPPTPPPPKFVAPPPPPKVIAPPPPKVMAPPPAPKAATPPPAPKPAPAAKAAAPTPPAPAPEPAPPVEPIGSEVGGNNLLLVAAKRLRSLQGGGPTLPKPASDAAPAPALSVPVEPMPEPKAAPAAPSSNGPVAGDPLLAAAARLRSMRGS